MGRAPPFPGVPPEFQGELPIIGQSEARFVGLVIPFRVPAKVPDVVILNLLKRGISFNEFVNEIRAGALQLTPIKPKTESEDASKD